MMELSSAQHHQEMATDSIENMLLCTKEQQERKPRPQQEQALKCPRCDSTNTKFCYYNNYSLTQPRYFCKSCRRYWTNGGTLRNVPVGGGCRKNKRPSSSRRSANSDHHQQPQPHHLLANSSLDHQTTQNNPLSALSSQLSSYDNDQYLHQSCSDLSLAFARIQKQTSGGYDQLDHHHPHHGHEHNLSLLGNYTNSHFGNIWALNNANNISGGGGGGHHGFLEGLKANLLEQTQFQNNNTNFHSLYNGGYGSNNSTSMSNISGDQIMIPYEDLSISSSFGTSKTAGLLKQEDGNIHQLNDNNPRPQILWGGAAGFPWHQINPNNNSHVNGHDIDHNNNHNMVDHADLVRENMSVFAPAAAPIWQGLISNPLM